MRIVRGVHGQSLYIPVSTNSSELTLTWPGGSATVDVINNVCEIPASVAAMVPSPLGIGEHTQCTLSIGTTNWLVDYIFDHSNHSVEAKYRWPT